MMCFLLEKGSSKEPFVAPLAKSILLLFNTVEKRFTDAANNKKGRNEKTEKQRVEVMTMVYHAIKAYKRRTTKPSRQNKVDDMAMVMLHGADLFTALNKMQEEAWSVMNTNKSMDNTKYEQRGTKRPREEEYTNDTAGADKKKEVMDKLNNQGWKHYQNKEKMQKILDELFDDKTTKGAVTEVFRSNCRNCWMKNGTLKDHTLKRCQELGNECVLICPKCRKNGKINKHWVSECK